MALTKLTKHIVYGATIVQCRYKDCSDLATSNTSVTTWDSMTLTPQYSDSILEVRFSEVYLQIMIVLHLTKDFMKIQNMIYS